MSANKAVQGNDILVKVLKENANFFAEQITLQFNEGICSSKYAESFKLANITPAFKQGSRNLKDNYRPISILPINLREEKSARIKECGIKKCGNTQKVGNSHQ